MYDKAAARKRSGVAHHHIKAILSSFHTIDVHLHVFDKMDTGFFKLQRGDLLFSGRIVEDGPFLVRNGQQENQCKPYEDCQNDGDQNS